MLKRFPYPGFLLLGLLLTILTIRMKLSTESIETSYNSVTATIARVHKNTHRSTYRYEISTEEYISNFSLNRGAVYGNEHTLISSLSSGDEITVLVNESAAASLHKKGKTPIYGLATNQVEILTPKQWLKNRERRRAKLFPVAFFTALMLIVNGVKKVPTKVNLALCFFFILLLIVF